jgi:hypothetical protein
MKKSVRGLPGSAVCASGGIPPGRGLRLGQRKEPSFSRTLPSCIFKAETSRQKTIGNTGIRRDHTMLNSIEIGGVVLKAVLIMAVFRLHFRLFTYEKRRGRESNPRIAVLQTATLPLGYPAGRTGRKLSRFKLAVSMCGRCLWSDGVVE